MKPEMLNYHMRLVPLGIVESWWILSGQWRKKWEFSLNLKNQRFEIFWIFFKFGSVWWVSILKDCLIFFVAFWNKIKFNQVSNDFRI